MIKGQFKLAGDIIDVVVKGNELLFMDIGSGMITPVTGLKFSKAGVLLEHPDLKDSPDWKKIAIKRLTTHMNNMKTEFDKLVYVRDELGKYGYECLHYQRAGHRPQKFKENK